MFQVKPSVCELCQQQQHYNFCVNCDAYYCRDCFSNSHTSKSYLKHSYGLSKLYQQSLQQRLDYKQSIITLIDGIYHSNDDIKHDISVETTNILNQLIDIERQQCLNMNEWYYNNQSLITRYKDIFDKIYYQLNNRLSYITNEGIRLAIKDVQQIVNSRADMQDVIDILTYSIDMCSRSLHSESLSDYINASNYSNMAIGYSEKILNNCLLTTDGTLLLSKVIDETTKLVELANSITAADLVSVEYPSNELYQKALKLIEEEANYGDGFAVMAKVASLGFLPAQMKMVEYSANGVGSIPANPQNAISWGMVAAQSPKVTGELHAMVAKVCLEGLNSPEESLKWLLKGADLNNMKCMRTLGTFPGLPPEEQKVWVRKSAEAGDVDAQMAVANELKAVNDDACLKYYVLAAKSGSVEGMVEAAEQYVSALSDYQQACFWYRKAAQLGNPTAQFKLATYLQEGNIVDDDNDPEEVLNGLSWRLWQILSRHSSL